MSIIVMIFLSSVNPRFKKALCFWVLHKRGNPVLCQMCFKLTVINKQRHAPHFKSR